MQKRNFAPQKIETEPKKKKTKKKPNKKKKKKKRTKNFQLHRKYLKKEKKNDNFIVV